MPRIDKHYLMTRRAANAGFTLIELLITVVLVGVLAIIGIPSYRSITTTNRIATEMNAFVGSLQYARSEAIKRGEYVTMCASKTGTSCLGSTNQSWTTGWIIFVDPNNNGIVNTGESILRIHGALQGGDTLNANAPATATFNRNGFSPSAQTLTLNNAGLQQAPLSCVVLSVVGRVRVGTIRNRTLPITAGNCA